MLLLSKAHPRSSSRLLSVVGLMHEGRRKGKAALCSVTSALTFAQLLAEAGHVTLYDHLIGYQLALCELGVSQSLGLLNFQPPTQSLSKNMEEDLSNFPKMTFIQSSHRWVYF